MNNKDKGAKNHIRAFCFQIVFINQVSRLHDDINMYDRSCNLGSVGYIWATDMLILACNI